MWTWTCTACGRDFTDEDKAEAERLFTTHARDDHNAKVVLSMETE
jgi:transposase-like protein